MKTCSCCRETKELSEFYKDKSMKDGLRYWCKFCSGYKNYLRRHPEAIREDYQAVVDNRALRFAEAPAGLKRCICCGETKELSEFYKNKSTKDGLQSYCKLCNNYRIYLRRHSEATREDYQAYLDDKALRFAEAPAGMKRCTCCGEPKALSFFSKHKSTKDGLQFYCKECRRKNSLYGPFAINAMARKNKKLGVPFNITLEEYQKWWFNTPDVCSYCGIGEEEYVRLRDFVLAYDGCLKFKVILGPAAHRKICTMTRDRFDNSLGYTMDNLRKSCWFCNCVKGAFLTGEQTTAVMVPAIEELRSDYERENRKVG